MAVFGAGSESGLTMTINKPVCAILTIGLLLGHGRAEAQVSAEAKAKMRAWADQQRIFVPEANQQIKQALLQEWLEIDGNWFSIQYMWGNSEFVEAKNLHWNLVGDMLGQADSLNNVEWRGTARFVCDASRTCPIGGGQWTQWFEGFGKLDTDHVWDMGISPYIVVKQSGQWNIRHEDNTVRWTKPRPDQLPGSAKADHSTTELDKNPSEEHDTTKEVNPKRISPAQSNPWNMVVGAWYGLLYWTDGTINKQEVVFSSDLTEVRSRASDRSAASGWGNYRVQRKGDAFTWEIPGPGRTIYLTLAPDRAGQRAKAECQIVQQGRVSHTAVGEFGRVDVPLP